MKNQKIVTLIVVLCVIGFLFTIVDYLALHDIKNEYVSMRILEHLKVTLSDDLPDWTSTKGEWTIVGISYFFRLIFFILGAILLYNLNQRTKTKNQEQE